MLRESIRIQSLLAAAVLTGAASLTAQANVAIAVEAAAPCGVAMVDENGQLLSQSFATGQAFTEQSTAHVRTHGTGSPFFIDYIETQVTPATIHDIVAIESRAYARNGTAVSSQNTIARAASQSGTQRFRITLTSVQARSVELDMSCSGQNFGNAALTITATGTGINQSWSFNTPRGHVRNRIVTPLTVQGVETLDVQIAGNVAPGPGGGLYHDGYDVRWAVTVRPTDPGSISYFGAGCSPASLSNPAAPVTGNLFTMQLSGVPTGAAPYFMIGTRNDVVPFLGIPLPLDLGSYGAPGCTLYVGSPAPMLYAPDPTANLPASIRFYLNPWYGGTWYIQGLVFDARANAAGFTTTRAARLDF